VHHILRGQQRTGDPLPIGKAALIASAGCPGTVDELLVRN